MGEGKVVGRLAPSPNGELHLGHALSFLCAWWSARSKNGSILLRMEDVDADRVGQRHIEQALSDLAWLGLDWDGEVRIQSTRLEPIVAAANRLLEQGKAYPCVCSRRDLARTRAEEESPGAPQVGVTETRYPGTCRSHGWKTVDEAEAASQKEAGLRFVVPEGLVEFEDGLYGRQENDVQKEVGDFLILRRNKIPAYQLAVLVDDHEDSVTEVVRGRDLLPSTARQQLLARALGLPRPRTFHTPLVCNHAGARLSKREKALGLRDLRAAGVRPGQIVSWAKSALGLPSRGEESAHSALGDFSFEAVDREDILLPEDLLTLFS